MQVVEINCAFSVSQMNVASYVSSPMKQNPLKFINVLTISITNSDSNNKTATMIMGQSRFGTTSEWSWHY
jgi:hypothetical protein